jgi:hypothetical protein
MEINIMKLNITASQTVAYAVSLAAFLSRVEDHQRKSVDGTSILAVEVEYASGHQYERVIVKQTVPRPHSATAKYKVVDRVAYIVERATGRIFAPLSPVTPNEKRYFGRIENASKWDWSGVYGVNKRDKTVKVSETMKYGDFTYYEDVPASELAAAQQDEASALIEA